VISQPDGVTESEDLDSRVWWVVGWLVGWLVSFTLRSRQYSLDKKALQRKSGDGDVEKNYSPAENRAPIARSRYWLRFEK
jgi:hypothetical protein